MRAFLPLYLIFFVAACTPTSPENAGEALHSEDSLPDKAGNIEEVGKWLLEKTPVSDEALMAVFPAQLAGSERTKISAIPDAAQVVANYGGLSLTISVADCAGRRASVATSFLENFEFPQEDTDSYDFENRERDGIPVVSMYYKKRNNTEMTALVGNRFYLVIQGEGVTTDSLWAGMDPSIFENLRALADE